MIARPFLSNRNAVWIGLWLNLFYYFLQADAAVVAEIGQNFIGSTYGVDSSFTPPDCNGAAGPDQFVELINGRFTVYAKTNGDRLLTMSSDDFWTSSGLTFNPYVYPTDPRIIYDPSVQRWFASAVDIDFSVSNSVSNRFLLAISTSADAAGTWKGLAFAADPLNGYFADFPTLGLDGNGIYLAAFMFTSSSANATDLGQTLVSIPKADLLKNYPTAEHQTWFGLLDSDNYGYVLQPVVNFDSWSGDATVLAMGSLGYDYDSHSNLVGFAVQNAAGPAPSTLTTPASIDVEPYSLPDYPNQPDGNRTLDDGDARLSANVYQVGGVLYAVHSCQVNEHAALRWYQLSATGQTVLQSGTIADTNLDLFYPSIAANSSGTVVIGFNGCSTDTFVSSFAVIGDTVDGVTTFGAPILLQAGLASYDRPDGRWGDYSSTCVDPADPNRFWTIQMYPVSTSAWATQITEVLTAIPKLTITANGTDVVLSWPGSAVTFDLESSPAVDASSWTVVPQTASWTDKGNVYLRLPATGGAQFFRLHKP